jgi:hypothetical protein
MHPFRGTAVLHIDQTNPMLKKPVAIFAILVFALSQYARQISFLECQLSNRAIPTELRCDCEKKLVATGGQEKSEPVTQHRHVHADEYFFHEGGVEIPMITCVTPKNHLPPEDKCDRCLAAPFQPPKHRV